MRRFVRTALAPVADEHGLGSLVSLHRRERPLIRFRAWLLWLWVGGGLVGLAFAQYNSTLHPDGLVLGALAAVYVLGLVVVGPVAAWALPADGAPRWVALFENGLVDVRLHDTDGYPRYDLVAQVVRFEQFRYVEQHRGGTTSMPRVLITTSSAARLVADRDGERLILEYHGYRRQDQFVDAVRARLAGGPGYRSESMLRRRGRVTFGNLVITRKALTVTDREGLRPSEQPTLRWADVDQASERGDGTVTIYRRPRPGEPLGSLNTFVVWYSAVVPDATNAIAMITKLRNKALS